MRRLVKGYIAVSCICFGTILTRLPRGEATEVMEKLSRLAPARAARPLERLIGTKDKADG